MDTKTDAFTHRDGASSTCLIWYTLAMKRDPFYQQILASLGRPLDPDLFERCAADILRTEWPTLVPVRGGTDAGMDGAVADGEGTAFPLICTTGQDVIGNLTHSLASYINKGGRRRRAILATSQELTPARRQNLEKRAQKEGFELIQIYSQAAIADRLYRNQSWCRELLNLSGNPPALSVVPPTTRPLLDIPLVGRTEDLEWLQSLTGDRLLVGQPGCGKTFLLHEFAKKDGGMFVVSRDRGEIAAQLREQAPHGLIVDDAHVERELLTELLQLRREMGLSFDLIACSWPGDKDRVIQTLGLAASQVHTLDLLTRDQILAVIKGVGIFGPDALLRELVDQAEGRPGLAVTLAHLCLHGGVREVALGDALNRSISDTFGPLVGRHATELLAGFSVGGAVGMEMRIVAQLFGLPLLDVRRDMARLAAGGVVQQFPEDRLVVQPEGLRHTLVRDLFFQGALPLSVGPFMAEAPGTVEVARTLIGARSRGGDVPDGLLLPLLADLEPAAPWSEYASLGLAETAYVLRRTPTQIETVAGAALYYLSDEALTRLLEAAIAGESMPSTARSLNLIRDWVQSARPGQGEAVPRRRAVVRAVARWLGKRPHAATGVQDTEERRFQTASQAVMSALSPKFEETSMDPGLGDTLRITRGVLTLAETGEMESVWAEALALLRQIPPHLWKPIMHALDDWAYPARHGVDETSAEMQRAMQALARQMVQDLAPLASEHPGLVASLIRVSRPLGIKPILLNDADFAILFPLHHLEHHSPERWREEEQTQTKAVQALADRWACHSPTEVAERLSRFEREANLAGLMWPRLTQTLCYELAGRTDSLGQWARVFADARLSGNFARPFLERAVALREEGWEELLRMFLDDPAQRGAALLCVLMLPVPPPDLLDEALTFAGGFTQHVETACLRDEVPITTVRRLIGHEDIPVMKAAVIGVWNATPNHDIPEELRQEWRSAVLCIQNDDHWLGEILKADRALTMDWLKARMAVEQSYHFGLHDSIHSVIASLNEAERISLLPLIPDCYGVDDLVGWLVGGSPAVYAELLEAPQLRSHHLVPLGMVNENVASMMMVQALDAGYDVLEIAGALLPSHWSCDGSVAAMWQQWVDRFERLEKQNEGETGDKRLREVAQATRPVFQQYRDQAQTEERARAVFGRR